MSAVGGPRLRHRAADVVGEDKLGPVFAEVGGEVGHIAAVERVVGDDRVAEFVEHEADLGREGALAAVVATSLAQRLDWAEIKFPGLDVPVFVPIVAAHVAGMWPGGGAQQLAGFVDVLLKTF